MSEIEQSLAATLQRLLDSLPVGAMIPDTEDLKSFLGGMEYFIPGMLRELHPEWNKESLDGILPAKALKVGPGEAEIVGECVLTTNQTKTPIHLRIQVDTIQSEISWLECRLGQQSTDGMKRIPYGKMWPMKGLLAIADQPDSIEWAYKVTFGQKIAN